MKIYISLYLLVLIGIMTPAVVFSQSNLARLSNTSVSTSFVSGWESLDAVNDGYAPINSTDRSHPIYGNWSGEADYGRYNWVEYTWPYANKVDSVSVYWFTDNGGLSQPTDAYIEYWDGLEWIKAGTIGNIMDQFNTLKVSFRSRMVRISMRSNTSTGIVEFRVFGVETTQCFQTTIAQYVNKNSGADTLCNYERVSIGDMVQFKPVIDGGGVGSKYEWLGPNNFKSKTLSLTLSDLQENQSGTYTFIFINGCGAETKKYFYLTVLGSEGATYTEWPKYNPTLNYDFRKLYPNFPMPVKNLEDSCSGFGWNYSDRWWNFVAGNKAKSIVTESAVKPLLERLNADFGFMRDSMGWPPDKMATQGYRSSVYLYGSGLCTDSEDSAALGGWQATICTPAGRCFPVIFASYYPVYSFDPKCTYSDKEYQKGGMVHEGIHAVLASLNGCKQAAWLNESGNTWLQMTMELKRSGTKDYSTVDLGWLSMGSVMAPFMPIEVYSGWLQDGSFGGPNGEGTYSGKFDANGTQLSITRNILGGVQYSKLFPTFIGEILGDGSNPWIWNFCPTRVLEGIADSIGADQTGRLIREYRARLALADMGRFTQPILSLYRDNMGVDIHSEYPPYLVDVEHWTATPYVKTTIASDGFLVPEERTLPGWSGANIIPIHTDGNKVVVTFLPLSENMSCQLCYRTAGGTAVYGEVVYGGNCVLNIDPQKTPANGVVFAVICNLNYIYEGETTRHAKYDYRLKLGTGATRTASVDKNWWDWTQVISDTPTAINSIVTKGFDVKLSPNPVDRNGSVKVELNNYSSGKWLLEVINVSGQVEFSKQVTTSETIIPGEILRNSVYVVAVTYTSKKITKKLVIK